MKKSIFCFVFIALILSGFCYSQDQNEITRLKKILDTISSHDAKIDIQTQISWEYTNMNNDSSLLYSDITLALAKKNEDYFGQVLAYESKGLYYEIVTGDLEKAGEFYFKGIELCRSHNLDYEVSLFHDLGVMFHTSDSFKKALEYYTITLDLATKKKDSFLIKKCLSNIGSVHSSLGNFDEAAKSMIASLNISSDGEMDFITHANLGNLFIRQKKYKRALPHILKSVEQHPNNYGSEINLYFLLQLKAITQDTVGMEPYVNRAIKAIDQVGIRDKSLLVRYLGDYFKSNGNLEKAISYRDRYIQLYDEIKDKQRDKTVLELEAKYNTEKKDREIAQQALDIEKKENQKAQLIGGLMALCVLLLLSGFFFWKRLHYQKTIAIQTQELQNQKITKLQQQNRLLALNSMIEGQETERMRIAKDLHDSLGGLLSTVKAHFIAIQNEIKQLQKLNITEKTNELIDEACVEVRRISHNMIPHALTISGLPVALEDMAESLQIEGFEIDLIIRNFPNKMIKTKQAMLYRLIQEVISNIRKHAQAKHILIQILGDGNGLNLTIEDDGTGFEYEKVISSGGVGLKSINSRVEFLNGTVYWDTNPGDGTTLTIEIPKSD